MTQGQIIMAIVAIVNAWALLLVKVWLDKRTAAKANPAVNQPTANARSKMMRRLRWFIALSLAVPTSLVVVIVTLSDFGRVSLFLTFLFTVESFVGFTMSFVAYSQISFASDFAEGMSKAFSARQLNRPWVK